MCGLEIVREGDGGHDLHPFCFPIWQGFSMFRLLANLLTIGCMAFAGAAHAQTLDSIRAAKHMECGTVIGADDWNGEDMHGNLSALEAEICRAVAIAIFGDAGA